MKKLMICFLISLFILIKLAIAEDFTIDVNVKEEYFAGREDVITLAINNPLPEDWFTISIIGVPQEWVFSEVSLLRVPAYGSNKLDINVKPSRDAVPFLYSYFIRVTRVSTKSEIEKEILINVRQVTSAILKDISLSCTICLEKIDFSGMVHNVGTRALDLVLIAKTANQQKSISIGKLDIYDKKPFQESFSLKGLAPGDYNLEFNLIDAVGNKLYTDSYGYKIPAIEDIVYDKEISTTPFGSLITVTAINRGNVISEAELKSSVPSWYSFYSGPTPTGIISGYYIWRTSLIPNERTSIIYSEIYWPTYAVIIIAVLISVFIYWQSTALVLTKNVMGRKTIKGGREVSVSLHVRNKRKEVDKVAVRDVVPSNFSIVSKFETVKPIIRKITDGVELVWRIGSLKPHEERVLHYTIKPAAEVVRRVHLPSALMKAMRGKILLVKRSNRVALHPEEEEVKIIPVKVTK